MCGSVIETPLSGAQSIHNMLIQSWGDKIRIFPAIPDQWSDVTFHNLLTEGAFLVSAVRKDGVTKFVHIKSLAGEPCKIIPNMSGKVNVFGKRKSVIKNLGDGIYSLILKKNQEAVLYVGDDIPGLEILPVPIDGVRE